MRLLHLMILILLVYGLFTLFIFSFMTDSPSSELFLFPSPIFNQSFQNSSESQPSSPQTQTLQVSIPQLPLHESSESKESSSESFPNTSSNSCLYKKAKFTKKELSYYWDYKTYQPCKILTNDKITVYEDRVEAKCANGQSPQFFFDPGEPELISNRRVFVRWNKNNRVIDKSQFVLIKCGISSVYTRVFMKARQEVIDRAEKKRGQTKPFTVAVLLLDSVSDLSAKKNLPESWKLLKGTKGANHFGYAKSFPYTTRENMIPVIYGMELGQQEELVKEAHLKKTRTYSIYLNAQEKAIWSDFSKLGFITLFGYDSAYEFLAMSLGPKVLTDHKFVNFYKLTSSVYRFTDMTENQRCAGDQGGHKPMLDYTLKYYQAYNGHLRFGYTHISAAHEDTGNIRTVDKDLAQFLRDFFEIYEKNQEDFVLFVMSDHGRMNKMLRFDNRGYLDVLNPMMFIVTSEGVGNSTVLRKNTQRMVGRFDLHLTLKDLAMFPYGGLNESDYESLKKNYSAKDVVSLFREEIKESRTCEDIGSSSQKCACDEFKPLNSSAPIHENIVKGIVNALNEYLFERPRYDGCEPAQILRIKKVDVNEIRDLENGLESVYKFKFELQYSVTLEAEIHFWFEKNDKFLQKFVINSKKHHLRFSLENQTTNLLLWKFKPTEPCNKYLCICIEN